MTARIGRDLRRRTGRRPRQGKLKAFRVAGKRKVLIPREELLKLLEPARGDFLDDDDEDGGSAAAGPNGQAPRGGKQ